MAKKEKEKLLNKVFNIDYRLILETITSNTKVKSTITSPPYFDMKDYGSKNQVGYGQKYDEYLDDLKNIFEQVFKITENDGTLWIIIDTLKRNNQVVPLPFDLVNKLKEVGWLLQDIIIWKKDKTVPWSTSGFMQRKFEYILFFSKSTKYKSNKDNVRIYDTSQLKKWWVKYPERYNPKGKALDEIWEFPIPVQGSWGDEYIRHFCPLPKELVATIIQISTDENDIILDPFAGSGTVLSQSAYMKRNYIGFELNINYIEMFKTYLRKTLSKCKKEYELFNNRVSQNQFEKTILELRALKYARILITNIQKNTEFKQFKIIVCIDDKSNFKNKLIKVRYKFIGQFDKGVFTQLLNEMIGIQPLSKYGIEPVFYFDESKNINLNGFYGYTQTNTYSFAKKTDINSGKIRVLSKICVDLNENDYL